MDSEILIQKLDRISDQVEALNKKTDVMNEILLGNGEPSKGLVIRTDRLEQNEQRRSWWIKTIATVVVGLVVTAVWSIFKHP